VNNFQRLSQAGLILSSAALSASDTQLINSLTPDEVSALISVKGKLGEEFLQQHLASRTIGIVF
jgi:hypothetical protein